MEIEIIDRLKSERVKSSLADRKNHLYLTNGKFHRLRTPTSAATTWSVYIATVPKSAIDRSRRINARPGGKKYKI